MSFPLLMAAALLSLGGDPDPARLEAGLHVVQRARYLDFSASQAGSTGQLGLAQSEVDPELLLRVPGELALHLGYAPRVYLPVLFATSQKSPLRAVVLQQVEAGVEQTRGLWRASAGATGILGETDPLSAAFLSGQAIPVTDPVPYHSAEIRAALSGRPQRRTTIDIAAAASYSGSSSAASASSAATTSGLPDQRGVRAGVRLAWNASAADVLRADLSGQAASTDGTTTGAPRTDGVYGRAGVGIEHALWRHGSVGAAAGIAAAYTLTGTDGTQAFGSFPWAQLSAAWTEPGMHPSFTVALGMEPAIDRLTGLVDVQGSIRASAEVHPERWTVGVGVISSFFQPWRSLDALSIAKGPRTLVTTSTLRAGHPVAEHVDLGAWAEVQVQHAVPGPGTGTIPSFSGVAAGLEISLQLR